MAGVPQGRSARAPKPPSGVPIDFIGRIEGLLLPRATRAVAPPSAPAPAKKVKAPKRKAPAKPSPEAIADARAATLRVRADVRRSWGRR
jgi:hypothetical protein